MKSILLAFALVLGGCTPPASPTPASAPNQTDELTPQEPVAFKAAPRMAGASDWPTLLGPTRDGVSTEKGIIAPWPKAGLKKLWSCELGVGFAPPVVAGGKLFHFDRFDDIARLTCRDAATGKQLWKFEYPMEYEDRYGYDPGPRACPVVDGDRVYIYGPDGQLHCVKTEDGKELWKRRHQGEVPLPAELLRRRQRAGG